MNLVKVNRKAADRAASGHPWLFSSDITDRGDAQPGDAVAVADPKGRVIGSAHYSSTSQIALRLLTNNREPIDRPFFLRRLKQAMDFRERIIDNDAAFR
ncbi:MAG: class I SAM-dependent rRNA methyltransferase, partial [Bryobacteraceae bacterium]